MMSERAEALWNSLDGAIEGRPADNLEGSVLEAVRKSLARVVESMDLLCQPIHRPAWTGRGEEA